MKLENEFTVPAPLEQAWQVLLDVERIAPCLPGATIDGSEGDTYNGTMAVKIGPITSRYKGTVKIERLTETLGKAGIKLVPVESNPIDAAWHDRPKPPSVPIAPHGTEYSGRSAQDKISDVQEKLREEKADAVLLTMLEGRVTYRGEAREQSVR